MVPPPESSRRKKHDAEPSQPVAIDYEKIQESPQFQELRKKQRSFVFPLTVFFLVWYLVYVLLAAYAHDFMSIKVIGNVNIGLLLGLGQFATTFIITTWYVHYANKRLDPASEDIRAELEDIEAGKVQQ